MPGILTNKKYTNCDNWPFDLQSERVEGTADEVHSLFVSLDGDIIDADQHIPLPQCTLSCCLTITLNLKMKFEKVCE